MVTDCSQKPEFSVDDRFSLINGSVVVSGQQPVVSGNFLTLYGQPIHSQVTIYDWDLGSRRLGGGVHRPSRLIMADGLWRHRLALKGWQNKPDR